MGVSSSCGRNVEDETAPVLVSGLNAVIKIKGVCGALVIRSDGTIITTAGNLDLDTGGFSASLSLLIAESGYIADRIQNGTLSLIFLEFENSLLMIQEMDYDRFIIVIARSGTNIGQIGQYLKKERQKPVPGV
jgi:predicted regulator of Ras-like GTPase activity (Roadblock/LC7/MglB family)